MTEEKFTEILFKKLQSEIKGYSISTGENLLYKIIVSPEGQFFPSNPSEPKRGTLAFQTDILVKKANLPLVVVETKVGGFSTHDVLTYSTKAVKHKDIYPYLRYGLVVGNVKIISNKFFTHNVGFDFAIAIENTKFLNSFVKLIRNQVKNAETLLKIFKEKNQVKLFSTAIKVKRA